MEIFDIYASKTNKLKFIVVEHNTAIEQVKKYGKKQKDPAYHNLTFYTVADTRRLPAIAFNHEKAKKEIHVKGYYLTSAKILATEK